MTRRATLRPAVLLAGLLAAGQTAAMDCAAIEDAQARACCERSLPAHAMRQSVSLAVVDDGGTLSELSARLAWKRLEERRVATRVDLTAPPGDAGTIVLLVQREPESGEDVPRPQAFLYRPSERRDRLIAVNTLSGELLGTDFSYEDFAYFYGSHTDMRFTRLADETLDGRTVMVMEARPRDADAAFDAGLEYTRITTRLDAERCVPLETEFYADSDTPSKRLQADPAAVRQVGERWLPHRLTMHDLTEGTRTIVDVEKVEFDPDISDFFFARSALKRGR